VIDARDAVTTALSTAEQGLSCGEMPVGAVVYAGDELVASAHTEERSQRRRIVYADLLALERADHVLGFGRRSGPLVLAVTLEPCLMCLGAAITRGVDRVYYALESPNDGAAALLGLWDRPMEQPFFRRPSVIRGGVLRPAAQELFAQCADGDGPAGMRDWCRGLARS